MKHLPLIALLALPAHAATVTVQVVDPDRFPKELRADFRDSKEYRAARDLCPEGTSPFPVGFTLTDAGKAVHTFECQER